MYRAPQEGMHARECEHRQHGEDGAADGQKKEECDEVDGYAQA